MPHFILDSFSVRDRSRFSRDGSRGSSRGWSLVWFERERGDEIETWEKKKKKKIENGEIVR